MEPEFWHERWQQNQIGFHQGEVNPYLEKFWDKLGVAAPASILVPLCGKSLDLMWLRQQGYRVEGVELSELAVRAFFEEQGLSPERSEHGDMQAWEADGIRLWCGDFFRLDAAMLGAVDAVYDRAALIALPAPMRQQYVRHVQALCGSAPHFLVTLEYPQDQMSGPPFSVKRAEVEALFGERYIGVTPLACDDALATSPQLRQRGLDALSECVYLLQVRKK